MVLTPPEPLCLEESEDHAAAQDQLVNLQAAIRDWLLYVMTASCLL